MQNTFDFIVIIISVLFSFVLFCVVLYQIESVKKGVKYSIAIIAFCCACGVISHAQKQSIIQAKTIEFKQAFYNNETLVCMQDNTEVHVHKSSFVYFEELGTFSGKDSTKDPNVKGLSVPILSCTQHVTTYDSDFIND